MAAVENAGKAKSGAKERRRVENGRESRCTAKMYFAERDYFSARVYPVEFHGHPA